MKYDVRTIPVVLHNDSSVDAMPAVLSEHLAKKSAEGWELHQVVYISQTRILVIMEQQEPEDKSPWDAKIDD